MKRHGIPNIELIRAYIRTTLTGQRDFEAVANVRKDGWFQQSLRIKQMPSSALLRQRFDAEARSLISLIDDAGVDFIPNANTFITLLSTRHVWLSYG